MAKRVILTISLLVSILLILVTSGCTSTKAENEDLKAGLPENLDYKIDISGGTKGNITLTYADLKAMEFVKKSQVTYTDSTGNKKVSDFVGIEWNDILEKGEAPNQEAYFKVYSPDGYNVVYTRAQADDTILAFKENNQALTSDLKNNPVHLVFVDGMQCHWVSLPVKIEISSTNPDEDNGTETNAANSDVKTHEDKMEMPETK